MKILGIRFCNVSADVKSDINFFEDKLGLENTFEKHQDFQGGIFATEDKSSWVECWQASEEMPEGIMLQIIVEDSDAVAAEAKANGQESFGPMDAHGERIYYVKTPTGLQISFQSKIPS